MKAMILAAGEGTRLRPYTQIQPKPAIPFCGYPLLYYSLFQLNALNVDQLVVNLFHLPAKVKKVIDSDRVKDLFFNVVYTNEFELGTLLGSGGGIAYAKKYLEESNPFLVCNGDEVIIPAQLDFMLKFKEAFDAIHPISLLLTMEHPEAGKKFGAVWVDEDNKVIGFGKTPPASEKKLRPLHFLGTQLLSNKIYKYLPNGVESNILYDALTKAIAQNEKVYAHTIQCDWFETGNIADYLHATDEVLKLIEKKNPYLVDFFNFWKKPFKNGISQSVTVQEQNSNSISKISTDNKEIIKDININTSKNTKLLEFGEYVFEIIGNQKVFRHKSVNLDFNNDISGFIVLGKNASIEKNIQLQNVVLADFAKGNQNLSQQLVLNE